MKKLISNDISRCNDYKCPTNAFCARFRQLRFDKENGNNKMSVTDFKGREKNGLCDDFLNADILAAEQQKTPAASIGVIDKELANWIYYEDGNIYYCLGCVEKRIDEINENKEFADDIDYDGGDDCGYFQDYADEEDTVECCKCGKPLFSTGVDA